MSVTGLQLAQSGATSETRPFAFLPPLGNTNTLPGQFDPGVSPVVQICEMSGNACAATVAEFTSTTGPGSETVRVSAGEEHYIVNWHTNQFDLDTAKMYRIRVRDGTSELGYADIKPVSSGQSLRRSRTEEVIPLLNGRTLPIKFWIGAPVLGGVPAQAPDTLPAYVFDDANIHNSDCISGEVVREILVVVFQPETPQVERQAAIDLIGGQVIGGSALSVGEGMYFVRVTDDRSGQVVCDAIKLLRTLPQVMEAFHDPVAYVFHRRPNDGSRWNRAEWHLDWRAPSDGERWGLVAASRMQDST